MNNIEFSIGYKGYGYRIIYGNYSNGYYIAIPYWKIACDASDPDNVLYNKEKLRDALSKLSKSFSTGYLDELARIIAVSIREISNEGQHQV